MKVPFSREAKAEVENFAAVCGFSVALVHWWDVKYELDRHGIQECDVDPEQIAEAVTMAWEQEMQEEINYQIEQREDEPSSYCDLCTDTDCGKCLGV